MSGEGNRSGSGGRAPGPNDDNLPLAEPDSIEEVPSGQAPAPPSGGSQRRRLSDATEASEPPHPYDFAAEEVTEGQLIDDAPIPGSAGVVVGAPGLFAPSPRSRSRDKSDTEPAEARIGTTLAGRYRIERVIAKGGMGRVYLATQIPLERQVAIKLLTNQRFDAEFRKRFFLEASTCARLVHRHIVTVHDYGEAENGELFMAMEYLDGVPLSKLIQKQVRLPSERACKIALQVCRALRAAHKIGVVHRDLKPGNVIVLTDEDQDGNDFIKVLDFGLVKAFEGADVAISDLTKSGTWLGSPRYMAPEQIRCQPVDPRTDIYSLGVILFHMLAGRPPFIGANSMEVLEQHLRDRPPAIADVLGRSDYAPELEVIIERCLKKEPGQRYQSMDELIGDLKAGYRLITGVSLHTESTLPTFAEISEASSAALAPVPSAGPPAGPATGAWPLSPVDHLSISQAGSTRGARVTGTIRAPLELLDASRKGPSFGPVSASSSGSGVKVVGSGSGSGIGRPPATTMPYSEELNDSITGFTQDGSLIVRSSTLRWVGLAAIFLLVTLAGFFSVKLFVPKGPATVKVRVDSRPRGAEVLLEGRRLGLTPIVFPMENEAPGTFRTFVVRKEGHEDVELSTQLQGEQVDLHAALIPVPPPAAPEAAAPKVEQVAPAVAAEPKKAIERRRREGRSDDDGDRPVRARRRLTGVDEATDDGPARRRRADGERRRRRRRADRSEPADRRERSPSTDRGDDERAARAPDKEAGSGPEKKKKAGKAGAKKPRSLAVGDEDRVVKESTVPVVD